MMMNSFFVIWWGWNVQLWQHLGCTRRCLCSTKQSEYVPWKANDKTLQWIWSLTQLFSENENKKGQRRTSRSSFANFFVMREKSRGRTRHHHQLKLKMWRWQNLYNASFTFNFPLLCFNASNRSLKMLPREPPTGRVGNDFVGRRLVVVLSHHQSGCALLALLLATSLKSHKTGMIERGAARREFRWTAINHRSRSWWRCATVICRIQKSIVRTMCAMHPTVNFNASSSFQEWSITQSQEPIGISTQKKNDFHEFNGLCQTTLSTSIVISSSSARC